MDSESADMENLVYEVKMRAKIRSYAPILLSQIRELDGIKE